MRKRKKYMTKKRKLKRKRLALLITLSVSMIALGTGILILDNNSNLISNLSADANSITSLELNKKNNKVLFTSTEYKLEALISPSNSKVTWTSSNPSVAEISPYCSLDGCSAKQTQKATVETKKNPGDAVITATAGGKSVSVTITVVNSTDSISYKMSPITTVSTNSNKTGVTLKATDKNGLKKITIRDTNSKGKVLYTSTKEYLKSDKTDTINLENSILPSAEKSKVYYVKATDQIGLTIVHLQ